MDPHHYDGWSGPLNACEADAEDMIAIAKSQGYDSKIMLTKAATRAAVIDSIKQAAEILQSGDIFWLTYSGHGGQLPDLNGDEDDDMDETWCLYDGELVDDRLNGLFARFKAGVRILMLSDSCHSGTVSKDVLDKLREDYASKRGFDPVTGALVGARFRGMPLDIALRTYRKNREEYDRELEGADSEARAKVVARVRLISGCEDEQLSSDGAFNGLFTSKLKRVWNKGTFDGNYAAFHTAILAKMPAAQKPKHFVYGGENAEYDAQRPFKI